MKHKKFKVAVKSSILVVLSMVLMLITGCWNNKDLGEINMVSGFGVESTEDGKVLVTAQVLEPAAIQSVSSEMKKGRGTLEPVFVKSYEGETVFEAIRGMLSIIDKKLFFSTAQVLILGERLSKKGIYEVVDFLQRDHELEHEMDVLVAEGVTPKEILEMENDMDSIPAVYINQTIKNTVSRGTVNRTMLIDIFKDLASSDKELVVGKIMKIGENELKTEGAAVFKGGKLAGWMDARETRGYLFATGKVKSAIINITADEGKIAMEVLRSKGKVDVKFENDEPVMLTVRVVLEANVGEYGGKAKLDSPETLYKLEEVLEEEVKKEIRMVLDKVQKDYSSDIFGFGTKVHKYHPQYWKKAKADWNNIFSKLPVDIHVEAKIKRTGTIRDAIKKVG